MPKVGSLGRSAHSSKARSAKAAKLAVLRGKEREVLGKKSAFNTAITMAKRYKEKGEK